MQQKITETVNYSKRMIEIPYNQFVWTMRDYKASLEVLKKTIVKIKENQFNTLEALRRMSEEERIERLADSRFLDVHRHRIPDITWQSLLMSIVGEFEYCLALLCEHIASVLARVASITLKSEFHSSLWEALKPKSNYIGDSKLFLGALFPDTREVFKKYKSFINNLSFFRNCVAHNGGFIPLLEPKHEKKVKRCRAFCKGKKGIDISVHGQIQVRPEFLEYSIDTLLEIFREIFLMVKDQAHFVSEVTELEGK